MPATNLASQAVRFTKIPLRGRTAVWSVALAPGGLPKGPRLRQPCWYGSGASVGAARAGAGNTPSPERRVRGRQSLHTITPPRKVPSRTRASAEDNVQLHPQGDPKPFIQHRVLHSPHLADYDEWATGAVMLIDKPQDWTSFDVCGKLRNALRRIGGKKFKVGHAGTLDPMATGLLIVCAGKATKQVDNYQDMDKVYTGSLKLGESTPSYDAESEVEERLPWEHITDEEIQVAASSFLGDILQVWRNATQEPPMYSAIKIGGEALYKKARRGETVQRKLRPVTIMEFSTKRDDDDLQTVHFRVECTKGTYIRSLANDLGRKLGSAAHLTALRRESIGEHQVANAWQVLPLCEGILAQYHEVRNARDA